MSDVAVFQWHQVRGWRIGQLHALSGIVYLHGHLVLIRMRTLGRDSTKFNGGKMGDIYLKMLSYQRLQSGRYPWMDVARV